MNGRAIRNHLDALRHMVAGMAADLAGRVRPGRGLRLAVLRLLRPVESALRRLIVAAAAEMRLRIRVRERRFVRRGPALLAGLRPRASRAPGKAAPGAIAAPAAPRLTAIYAPLAPIRPPASATRIRTVRVAGFGLAAAAIPTAAATEAGGRVPAFRLFDPWRRLPASPWRGQPPRICMGWQRPAMRPEADLGALARRIEAVRAAMDELPRHALRFARWRALHEHEVQRRKAEKAARAEPSRAELLRRRDAPPPPAPRPRRGHPFRTGRPPGGRMSELDLLTWSRGRYREVDRVLAFAHSMAEFALAEWRFLAGPADDHA